MKVWIKYLIGIAIGILAAVILPLDTSTGISALTFLTDLFVRFGRYLVVPLIFSSIIVSINKLRSSGLFLKVTFWTFLIIIVSTLVLVLIGLASILIVKLPRIPITIDVATEIPSLNVKELLFSLFPGSAFSALGEGSFLLVSILFGSLVGWESATDQVIFKPVFNLADSLSQLFYNISVFFTEVMSVLCIAIMANWLISARPAFQSGIYTPMIIMFLVDFVLVAAVIYPLILRYACHELHPYKVLYASIAPMLFAFLSGDSNLVLPLNIRHGKESLGIKRRISGFTYPLFSVFARGGSALVVAVGFILIWRSYSTLRIPLSDIIWIFGVSFGLSFLLCGTPSGGAFILLTILCSRYGRGFETSFLLLRPAAVIICSFSALFDCATAMFGSYVVGMKVKMIEHHTINRFI